MLLNILIPLICIVFDQIVKYWASTELQAMGSIPLWEGVFHRTYCENTGAAFSMFTGQRWMLLGVTVVLLVALLWALYKGWMQNAFGRLSLQLIIGGRSFHDVALFVAKRLSPLDDVRSTATHFVLRKYKDKGVIYGAPEVDERGNFI